MLASGALVALPAGLLMDRVGRVPVLAAGFTTGIAGCALASLGSANDWALAVLGGLMLVGAANATALLARTPASDMYPPARGARSIALVLFSSVFGAILGLIIVVGDIVDRFGRTRSLAAGLWILRDRAAVAVS